MKCITIDKDGKQTGEFDRDILMPLKGYENIDGVFRKTLGDPRCITDTEKRQAIITSTKHSDVSKKTIIIGIDKPIDIDVFLNHVMFIGNGRKDFYGTTILSDVCVTKDMDIAFFKEKLTYSRIEFHYSRKIIKIWKTQYKNQRADIVILNAVSCNVPI